MANLTAHSALADRHQNTAAAYWENGAVALEELPFLGMVRLQKVSKSSAFLDAVAAIELQLSSPGQVVDSDGYRCLWLTPDEWLFVVPAGGEDNIKDRLASLPEAMVLITDISDSRLAVAISGQCAANLLAKGSAVDWHPDKFVVGQCAITRFAQVAVMVQRSDEQRYELYVDRAYASYLWDWLVDAASEFNG